MSLYQQHVVPCLVHLAMRQKQHGPFRERVVGAAEGRVVTTWTMCTIPNAPLALAEIRRVLRLGGALRFVEHGRAPEPGVGRWQDRLDPLWSRIAGGCHLNRKMDDLIVGNGFRIEALENARLPGPRTHTFLYEGSARPR